MFEFRVTPLTKIAFTTSMKQLLVFQSIQFNESLIVFPKQAFALVSVISLIRQTGLQWAWNSIVEFLVVCVRLQVLRLFHQGRLAILSFKLTCNVMFLINVLYDNVQVVYC